MLKDWQFNILFFVGVGGAVFLLVGPEFGLNLSENPTALTGVGAILTYILTQRNTFTKSNSKSRRRVRDDDEDDNDNGVSEKVRGDDK